MIRRFRGEGTYKLDDKGRLLLPPAIRSVLAGPDGKISQDDRPNLVMVYGEEDQRHLEVYTEEAMEELIGKIERLPAGNTRRDAEVIYFGHTDNVEVDAAGRILLRSRYREQLGLGDEGVYVVGLGTRFEIWRKDEYDADKQARRADPTHGGSRAAQIMIKIDEELSKLRGGGNG